MAECPCPVSASGIRFECLKNVCALVFVFAAAGIIKHINYIESFITINTRYDRIEIRGISNIGIRHVRNMKLNRHHHCLICVPIVIIICFSSCCFFYQLFNKTNNHDLTMILLTNLFQNSFFYALLFSLKKKTTYSNRFHECQTIIYAYRLQITCLIVTISKHLLKKCYNVLLKC